MRNTAASSLKSGTVGPERLSRVSQSLSENYLPCCQITLHLSCCLKLTSFKGFYPDAAKNKYNRGASKWGYGTLWKFLMDKAGASMIRRGEAHRMSVFA